MSVPAATGAAARPDRPERLALSRWLFLRLLAGISFVAFASYGVQARGLVGERGISPLAEQLASLEARYGAARLWRAPTLFWLDSSDVALVSVCVLGCALSLLLALGLAPRLVLLLLWSGYLSLETVGDVFLGYQWDALLTEVLLASVLFAPGVWRERLSRRSEPPRLPLWLLRLVLFKLMILSGVVKLASGDPTWRELTALEFHYWTQPLPSFTSAWAAALPSWLQRVSTLATLALELVVPLLLLVPGRTRRLAALATLGFQLLIAATGNYGFFNLLTIALCLPFLDDDTLLRALPARLRTRVPEGGVPTTPRRATRAVLVTACSALLLLSALVAVQRLVPPHALPGAARAVLRAAAPWQSVNPYGLFAVMTTDRREILLEGSHDGKHWISYAFRFKPAAPDRRPPFATPHMPRLDWQLWFAALRGCRYAPWFARFAQRLLEGSPEVLALLEEDPFPERPPRWLRSWLQHYRFTTSDERARTGAWWKTEGPRTPYCPPLVLEGGRLAIAPEPVGY